MSSYHQYYYPKAHQICVGNIGKYIDRKLLIAYFENFGSILYYNFTSSTDGYAFITYRDRSMVDGCLNAKPHHLNGRYLYVKRALSIDDEHPRERFVTTRDLMIVIDSNTKVDRDPQFLSELREYFSTYGRLYTCKYCQESHFDYILVQFADEDQVDRIIFDKPHYYNEEELNVMKCIRSNIDIQNKKYSSNKGQPTTVKDAIDDDDSFDKNDSITADRISEIDLKNEVYRLQNILKKMNDDFALKRRELEDEYCEQLKKLQRNTDQTHSLQQELEQEHAKLLVQCEAIKNEKETLNEQYLTAELENFEITSYYEQILAEEKAKTIELQTEYQQKLDASRACSKHSASSSISSPVPVSTSSLSKSSPRQTTSSTD